MVQYLYNKNTLNTLRPFQFLSNIKQFLPPPYLSYERIQNLFILKDNFNHIVNFINFCSFLPIQDIKGIFVPHIWISSEPKLQAYLVLSYIFRDWLRSDNPLTDEKYRKSELISVRDLIARYVIRIFGMSFLENLWTF